MTRPNRRALLAMLATATTGVVAGCAGNDDDGSQEQNGGTDDQRETVTEETLAPTQTGQDSSTQQSNGDDSSPTQTDDGNQTPTREPVPSELGVETLTDGLQVPVDVVSVPGTETMYVGTRPGEILVHGTDGLRDAPLLDLRERVVLKGERGLLGITAHPEFPDDGRLFVRYSSAPREGTPPSYSHTAVLAAFQVDPDRARADPDSEQPILEVPQPQSNHNAGDLAFGPDGNLYVPFGDGGGSNDTGEHRPDDWYEPNNGGNGQDTRENLLGGILRIDVDDTGTEPYAIPPDNPLVDREGHLDEYYAWGLRNPWRISVDGTDLYVSDVGQNRWESVYRVERGGNYGWNVREGSHCFDADDPSAAPDGCPRETPPEVRGGEPLLDPILEYPNRRNENVDTDGRPDGVAVVGGHVYRGSALPGLSGRYLFGDYRPNGRLYVGTPPGAGSATDRWELDTVGLTDGSGATLEQILSFERDEEGELYVLNTSGVHRIVPAT